MKKYKLTDETRVVDGETVYRIEATKDFSDVKAGDKGGFVQSEDNLSHEGLCWIDNDAVVMERATVKDDVKIIIKAIICGSAEISDSVIIGGTSEVSGEVTEIYENVKIIGDSCIHGKGDECPDISGSLVIDGLDICGGVFLSGSITLSGDVNISAGGY